MKIEIDTHQYSTDRIIQLMDMSRFIAMKQGTIINKVLKLRKTTSANDCYKIHQFANKNFKFKIDDVKLQKIILPIPLINIKQGDCKSFTMFGYGCLAAMGYNPKIKFVSYDSDPQPSHVYLTVNDIVLDSTIKKFDFEYKHKHYIII